MTLDIKKTEPHLYRPTTSPCLVDVPPLTYLAVDGRGDPNLPDGDYAAAVAALYAVAYTIKMAKKGGWVPDGYVDFVVPPLEGFWDNWSPGDPKSLFTWTMVLRAPAFVTPAVLTWAVAAVAGKKPGVAADRVALTTYTEGRCVQALHLGPYDTEPATVAVMDSFAVESGNAVDLGARRHHEIYLTDPNRTDPAKLRTIVRHPIRAA